jgi:hypothetical protein
MPRSQDREQQPMPRFAASVRMAFASTAGERGLLLLFVLAGVGRAALAAPPPDADPALAPWFNSLRQPWTNALCCSMADCRPVDSRLNDGHYEALIEGEWRRVPDHLILNRSDNPTGRAIVCWTAQVGILCFVRAPES